MTEKNTFWRTGLVWNFGKFAHSFSRCLKTLPIKHKSNLCIASLSWGVRLNVSAVLTTSCSRCFLASGGSNEPITAWCTRVKRRIRGTRTINWIRDTNVRLMVYQKYFSVLEEKNFKPKLLFWQIYVRLAVQLSIIGCSHLLLLAFLWS